MRRYVLQSASAMLAAFMAMHVPTAGIAAEMHTLIAADAVKWGPAPPALPKGIQFAVLTGNPGKNELFIVRIKASDGQLIPAHWHSKSEQITVLSGQFHLGQGDKLDKTKAEAIGPGGFAMMPAKMRHYAWVTGETVVQIAGLGPFDITYVNSADDPRGAPMGKK